ncbi:hypothetical protein Esti_006154 [Eimeria stiedai]
MCFSASATKLFSSKYTQGTPQRLLQQLHRKASLTIRCLGFNGVSPQVFPFRSSRGQTHATMGLINSPSPPPPLVQAATARSSSVERGLKEGTENARAGGDRGDSRAAGAAAAAGPISKSPTTPEEPQGETVGTPEAATAAAAGAAATAAAAAAAATAAGATPEGASAAAAATAGGEPRLLVIAGPSGVGKGTLVKRLRAYWPTAFGFSVSHTTRQPRAGETSGRDYYFVDLAEIKRMQSEGQLLELAEFSGNVYATSIAEVNRISSLGRICLLEIDLVGVKSLRRLSFRNARFVFIEPPSFAELERRLKGRRTDAPESIDRRLSHAKEELEASKELDWDLRLLNDEVDAAWCLLRDAVAEWFNLTVNPQSDAEDSPPCW